MNNFDNIKIAGILLTEELKFLKYQLENYIYMPPKTAAAGSLRDIVRHERRVELAMEGHRIWDLLRWGIMKQTTYKYSHFRKNKRNS